MGIRDYIKANPPVIRKGLEPTHCGLCGGDHSVTALFMCGQCMGGLADYMGGGDAADKLRMGRTPGDYSPKTAPVTSHSSTNANRAAALKDNNGVGLPSSPRTTSPKPGPHSDRDSSAAPRREEPATHSSTNSTRAHSRPMPR